MARIIPLLLIISVLLSSCRSCNQDQDANKEFDIPDELMNDEQPLPVSSEVIDEIVQNVSSPVETAALIKGLKVPFNKDYMASTNSAKNMNTSFQKALGLGIYGADLGYLNMYEKTTVVIDYISTVKDLADGIQVGQFFDFNTLRRIATNKENLDSLMLISQQSFNRIDSYLRETNRASLSVVIIAGVWLEGLYLSTRVAQDANHPRINETIGEQKVIMGTLMALLDNYKRDPNIATLISDFEEIKDLYKDVTITYEIGGEPTPVVKDGVLTFVQNDVQTIKMSDETLKAIITKVQTLRNKFIS
ncbi:MAG TPA: hypothetical protein PL017_06430 [Tenuifilaceae bacterium]|nr:hypothetical protein [Tenuifilaceae bacterium]HPE18137.1 hypothetical protein [Tenuifilaceae bacterium]HPJ45718.1 hypothetical protein [Tenuifilaceae bacterium]HPQ34270.1 hypothetical protein [Tenuifilaceae bacterium]HRX67774.1 hypothetical protein [Tenuifilaceae bacterium]